jgi:Ni/Fe-hydrogenase subunit HybB-like protein
MANSHAHHHEVPVPIKHKYFTPGMILVTVIALNGVAFIIARFIFGLGAVTNLDQQFPWGIWIGIDVGAGVALAAGGFMSAAIGHIMHREEYETLVRPALLTAMLGYTFVAFGVMIDLGRWYFIWHPLVYWNPNSALFEVGICVMIYLTVLYIEFLPIVTERFIGRVKLGFLTNPIEKLLLFLDRNLNRTMFIFIIAGVVLSSLHQSSLGTLMVISGAKMHPLWQTPVLPLLFLISAVAVGFPMIIFESLIASNSFKVEPEWGPLSKLARFVGPLLGVYLMIKLVDMFIRESFVYLYEFNVQSVMFLIEVIAGVIIPMLMFFSDKISTSRAWLFTASTLVIFGVFLNRLNNFVIAYDPPFDTEKYVPSIGELSVTIGAIAIIVMLYRFFVLNFPIISLPKDHPKAKKLPERRKK